MESITAKRPMNRWDHDSIRPGVVGSVGDVLLADRLKSSLPGDYRFEARTAGRNESRLGSNVQNGECLSYVGSGPPRTFDSNWQSGRTFRHSRGWKFQDIKATDRAEQPIMGALPHFMWNQITANVENSKYTGRLFSSPSGVNGPAGGVPRGGAYPQITDVVEGGASAEVSTNSYQPNYKPGESSNLQAQQSVGLGGFRSGASRGNSKRR
jgi:hypothetical protein